MGKQSGYELSYSALRGKSESEYAGFVRRSKSYTDRDVDAHEDCRTPVHRLLYGVLERASRDLNPPRWGADDDGTIERDDAQRWFLSDSTTPFSFLWIVDHLNISPATIKFLRGVAENPSAHSFPNSIAA